MYDIIVIGAGPAGLTAAVYSARAGKNVLVLEKGAFGGQITYSPRVENIPGFISVTGNEFAEKMVEQVLALGVDIEPAEVLEIKQGATKTVVTDFGNYECEAIIIATGAKHRLPGLNREEEFIGNGISFCAVCDGAFYEGKTVAVLGGGNSAMQEALLLSELCKKVYIIQNLEKLTGEEKLAQKLVTKNNVEIIYNTLISELIGEAELSAVLTKRVTDGVERKIEIDGLFVAIGLVPQNEIIKDLIPLDKYGYADIDESCITPANGIFVAGDCRKKNTRQVTTAVADGAIAALRASEYVDSLHDAK